MPKAFKRCVASGGRVRTIKRDKNHYQHVCFSGARSYAGEVKRRRKTTQKRTK